MKSTIEDLRKEFDLKYSNQSMPIREWLDKYSQFLEQKLIEQSEGEEVKSAEEILNKFPYHTINIEKDFKSFGNKIVIEAMEEYANQFTTKQDKPVVTDEEIDKMAMDEYPKISSDTYAPDQDENFYERLIFTEGICKGLSLSQSNKGSEWISVFERLPDLNKMVIVFSDKVETLAFVEIEDRLCITDFNFYPILLSDSKVTHWMELPQPPFTQSKRG